MLTEQSYIDKPEGVNARNDKSQTGPLGSSFLDPTKSEDDCSLVLINSLKSNVTSAESRDRHATYFDAEPEGDW